MLELAGVTRRHSPCSSSLPSCTVIAKETSYWRHKRPTIEAKETRYRGKRDLLLARLPRLQGCHRTRVEQDALETCGQKRPTDTYKKRPTDTYKRDLLTLAKETY